MVLLKRWGPAPLSSPKVSPPGSPVGLWGLGGLCKHTLTFLPLILPCSVAPACGGKGSQGRGSLGALGALDQRVPSRTCPPLDAL